MEKKYRPDLGQPRPEAGPSGPEKLEFSVEAPAEVGREIRSAKETIAEMMWAAPANFAGSVLERGPKEELAPFLEKVAGLDGQALDSRTLKQVQARLKTGS